jgi:hypothetical protein
VAANFDGGRRFRRRFREEEKEKNDDGLDRFIARGGQ